MTEFDNFCTYSGHSLMVNNTYMSKKIKTKPVAAHIFILAFISIKSLIMLIE